MDETQEKSNSAGTDVGQVSMLSTLKKRPRDVDTNSHIANDTVNGSPDSSTIEELYHNNPLYLKQHQFLQSLSYNERHHFFSSNPVYGVTPERRSEIWNEQCRIGEECIEQYSWVTPDKTCLKILSYFSPIIEIGCGANAYWCQQMKIYDPKIDVVGYDISPQFGGKIASNDNDNTGQSVVKTDMADRVTTDKKGFEVLYGGPEVLRMESHKHRTLFLCYPDENTGNTEEPKPTKQDDKTTDHKGDDDDEEQEEQYSMAYDCIKNYSGTFIIHVGELMNPATPIIASDSNPPYGRTSSYRFQEYLYSHYHCILVYNLSQHWLHTQQDCLTVWKRSSLDATTIVYSNDDDNDDDDSNDKGNHDGDASEVDDEVQYRHIPDEERLPVTMAAPCVQHLSL